MFSRRPPRPPRRVAALAILTAMALLPEAARAQIPQPVIPDARERSGLFTRIIPIKPRLPVDKDRDLFYDTQWQPRHRICWGHWINSFKDGGLYGRALPADCTSCRYPFYRGSPGASTIDPHCKPPTKYGRILGNFVHPFKPVDMYYSGGCYTPVYDLDPLVPGPGWFPWWVPDFANKHMGG